MAKPKVKKSFAAKSLQSYLWLSIGAAAAVGIFVYGGVRSIETTAIWVGVTFIVALVSISTLALSVKEDDSDPNEPKLK
jgi:hypothetical protein